MKKIALAAAMTVVASSSFAGGVAEPVQDPAVIEAEAASSGAGLIVPLLVILVVAAVAVSN